jgi:hypothetical protein
MATAVAPAAMVWLNDRGSQVTALWLAIDPAVTAVDMAPRRFHGPGPTSLP